MWPEIPVKIEDLTPDEAESYADLIASVEEDREQQDSIEGEL